MLLTASLCCNYTATTEFDTYRPPLSPHDCSSDFVQVKAPTQVLTSPAIGPALVFRPDGRARGTTASGALVKGTVAVCLPVAQPVDNARDVTITFGSQVSVSRRNGTGACAAPTDPI